MLQRNAFLAFALLGALLIAPAGMAQGPAAAAACAACHGPDGNSINPIWPNLAGQGAPYIVSQLQAFKSGQRNNPSMSPMAAGLDESSMNEVAQWYASQAGKVAPMGDEDFSGAQKLYRGGDAATGIPACMACHGPNGAGNAPAGYPALRGQHAAYTAAQLTAYRDGTRPPGRNEVMGDIARRLTDEQIDALSRYVSALH